MYTPGQVPTDAAKLSQYVREMEKRIAFALNNPQDTVALRQLHNAPARNRAGDVLYADGADFDPAGGEDLYFMASNGAWVKPGRLRLKSKSTDYTITLADANEGLFHPAADTTARTWTIPANASVAYPLWTTLTFVNETGAGDISIAITSDTLRLANTASTGTRTLAENAVATAIKITSTVWMISGTGLT